MMEGGQETVGEHSDSIELEGSDASVWKEGIFGARS